eukprot:SAG31_NODE_2242_length_6109_cov_18.408819_3_plen_226_part_00
MDELKASSLSIADRAKIRLLLAGSPSRQSAHWAPPRPPPSAGSRRPADRDTVGAHSSGQASGESGQRAFLESVSQKDECASGSKPGQRDAADAQHRSLQGSDGQGMSMDTIAIAVSVLFATVGYLLQCASNANSDEHFLVPQEALRAYSSWNAVIDRRAYTARRAEQSAQAQAQEDHAAELTRNRCARAYSISRARAHLLSLGGTARRLPLPQAARAAARSDCTD